jgi:hypothetical protein
MTTKKKGCLIRILSGGEGSSQTSPFNQALTDIKSAPDNILKNAIIETKTVKQLLDKGLSKEEIIVWGEEANILISTCHPFQDDEGPLCDYNEFIKEYREMMTRHGNVFPSVLNGAYSQDKNEYYEALKDIMNPTLKIDRPSNVSCELDKEIKLKILTFCKRHPGELRKRGLSGWHIKSGFSTGSKMRLSTRNIKRVPRLVKCLFKKRKGRRPYVMVQETMVTTHVSI